MKGGIDLGEFIHQVKKELVDAQVRDKAFMELTDVELEVNFALDASGTAGMSFLSSTSKARPRRASSTR